MSDILLALDAGDITAVALLDLAAVFDTVEPQHPAPASANFIWSERRHPVVVSLVPGPASAARVSPRRAVSTVHRPVWRAAGVRTGPAPVHDVHCRCSQHRRATTSVSAPVCRRHTSLQPASPKRLDVALQRPWRLDRTCCQLYGHEPSSAERRKDGIHMVRSTTSAPPVSVRSTCSWLCSGDTSRLSTRPRRLPGQ